MAQFIYAEESFPGSEEKGRKFEYAMAFGIQVIIPEKEWFKLKPVYSKQEQGLPVDLQGKPGTKQYTAEQVAGELVKKYSFIGLVNTNSESGIIRSKLEEEATKVNRNWRKSVINSFEDERRRAILRGAGRLEPTLYEMDCYRILGIGIPTEPAMVESKREVLATKETTVYKA